MNKSNWFARQRVVWIIESLKIFGSIRLRHICEKFDISRQTAISDMKAVADELGDAFAYDKSAKQYVYVAEKDAA